MAIPPPQASSGYQLWWYYPSIPGGVSMAAIFGVMALSHLFMLVRSGRRFCIPLVIGGAFETIGYCARTYAHWNTKSTLPFTIQSLLILLAPILFAASVYMYLGRIMLSVGGEKHSLIPLKWLTKTFVSGDVLCFIIQGAGGGVMAIAKSSKAFNLGEKIILTGLVLQIVIFCFFVVTAARFHVRMARDRQEAWGRSPWQRCLLGLYAVSVLITIRNAVRCIEFGVGSQGYLLQHEWCTFVFDGAMMALVLVLCLTWYFSDIESTRMTTTTLESQDSAEKSKSHQVS